MVPHPSPTIRLAFLCAVLAAACGGDDLTLPNEGEPAVLEAVRGDGQNGTVGEALGDSLVVEVTDRFDEPVEGVAVTWSAEGGGTVAPLESSTGPDGRAGTQRILGPQPGTYLTIAVVEGVTAPVTFTTTGLAARLLITSELPAIAVSGVPLVPQPTLRLEDAAGVPIAREGVVVTVQIASGGGSLDGATTATSDPSGQVAFTDLAIRGSPGVRRLIFAADAFAPATSAPIGLGVGSPTSIEGVAGDDQSAPAGTAVAVDPSVMVRDGDGNPLPGIPVTFAVTAGGGRVTGATPVTGSDGVATVGEWRLGDGAGANTLSASVAGQSLSGSPVVFSATAEAGAVSAAQSTVTVSPASIPASNGESAATITVTVKDQFGNPIPDVEVSLAATGNGNALVQPGGATNDDGVVTGRLSATVVGAHVVSATAGGTALDRTATVTVTAGTPAASNSSANVPNGQSGEPTTIDMQLKDAFGNNAPDARTSIGVVISGANPGAGVTVSDEGGGAYRVRYTPIVAGEDIIALRVEGTAIAGSPFTSVVSPGPVSPAASTAVVERNGSIFAVISIVVTARDAQGNPVGRGGERVEIWVNEGGPVLAEDKDDGTYEATIVTIGANFKVEIEMNGVPIKGSPFRL